MASLMLNVKMPACLTRRAGARAVPVASCRVRSRLAISANAQRDGAECASQAATSLSLAMVASSWFAAGNAQAAQELSSLAASDGRLGYIALLFIPALGWVAFNILQPFQNQLAKMEGQREGAPAKKVGKAARRAVAAAVGLGAAATIMGFDTAQAAAELGQIAASDNRVGTLATLFVPALAWVAYNIFQPYLNQVNRMEEMRTDGVTIKKPAKAKRGVAAVVGLGGAASLFAAGNADAATEIAQLAASDSRLSTIGLLFLPALGWVAFNIFQPFLNQLNRMADKKDDGPAPAKGTKKLTKKRSVAGLVGMGTAATLLAAQHADAATELAQVAASDNRFGSIALLFIPALGWVAFNIAQPFLNQLNKMSDKLEGPAPKATKKVTKKRGVAAVVGLGAASLLAAVQSADAATEVAQLAASDGRAGSIALLVVPALGWVAYNILQPFQNQLNRMSEMADDKPVAKKAASRR